MVRSIIGILGGMGPAASIELMNEILKHTDAKSDNEHVHVILINDPEVPDRTKYILGHGRNPVPRMKKNIKKLECIGVHYIMIPCMTAHHFIDELQLNTSVRIINAIKLVDNYLYDHQNIENIGLLATTGSVKSGVYEKFINRTIILPNKIEQEKLMSLIYGESGIKAGNTSGQIIKQVHELVTRLKHRGAQAVIAGCTELGLVMNNYNMPLPVLDPIKLLAKKAVLLGTNIYNYTEDGRK